MGYNVDGFLVADQRTLINSWNFKNLNLSTVWHGNEVVETIDEKNLENSTNTDNKITLVFIKKLISNFFHKSKKYPHLQSAFGIKKAFEFLEEALLKIGNVTFEIFLHHHAKGRYLKNTPRYHLYN